MLSAFKTLLAVALVALLAVSANARELQTFWYKKHHKHDYKPYDWKKKFDLYGKKWDWHKKHDWFKFPKYDYFVKYDDKFGKHHEKKWDDKKHYEHKWDDKKHGHKWDDKKHGHKKHDDKKPHY